LPLRHVCPDSTSDQDRFTTAEVKETQDVSHKSQGQRPTS
jgi:hypothetical protein